MNIYREKGVCGQRFQLRSMQNCKYYKMGGSLTIAQGEWGALMYDVSSYQEDRINQQIRVFES